MLGARSLDTSVHAGSHYQLHCQALDITLNCQLAPPVARLLEVMLSGWSLLVARQPLAWVDLEVEELGKYKVQATSLGFHAEHKDLVSTFNEVLICIAYLVCQKQQELVLIHGGALLMNQPNGQVENTLLLGGHKAGKSTYLAKHCQQDNLFVSDDLLWINGEGLILGLGFPLRLRRPINEDVIALYGAKQLLAGHSLAYIGPKGLPVQPAGKPLHVDRVLLLENFAATVIPQAQWLAMIEQRIVPIPEAE